MLPQSRTHYFTCHYRDTQVLSELRSNIYEPAANIGQDGGFGWVIWRLALELASGRVADSDSPFIRGSCRPILPIYHPRSFLPTWYLLDIRARTPFSPDWASNTPTSPLEFWAALYWVQTVWKYHEYHERLNHYEHRLVATKCSMQHSTRRRRGL